jgi:hypothetical protein
MPRHELPLLALGAGLGLTTTHPPRAQAHSRLALAHAGSRIDGVSDDARRGVTVAIENGRIAEVVSGFRDGGAGGQ